MYATGLTGFPLRQLGPGPRLVAGERTVVPATVHNEPGALSHEQIPASFSSYDYAVKAAVRAMAAYRKPIGVLAWAGKHAQMLVGYYGLSGDPFAKDSAGKYTNAFTVAGFYLADPLRSQGLVNARIPYLTFKTTSNMKLRFRPYLETDSPYDDRFTPGIRPSRDEWYGRFVIVAPIR